MKGLEIAIARSLKSSKHFKKCYRCYHMNNGAKELQKRICICHDPILVPIEQKAGGEGARE